MIHFDIIGLEKELSDLESQTTKQKFWEDSVNSSKILKRITDIKNKVHNYNSIKSDLENLIEIKDLLLQENDTDLENELQKGLKKSEKEIQNLEISTLLSGKYDNNNAIVTIHPGAGGTEAQDWAEMLYRMYTRWANSNGYKIEETDYLEGDEAGLKTVTFVVSGEYAYGYLKGEQGVHRLVRISPFDAGKRRHTSFASVEVLPEISDDVNVEINQKILE